MVGPTAAGSPGPFEMNRPSGSAARIAAAERSCGATSIAQPRASGFDRFHTSWLLLLLLAHFNLFWHTIDLLTVEEWEFEEFLFTIAGPISMFFCTQVLLSEVGDGDGDVRERYFTGARRFEDLRGDALGLLRVFHEELLKLGGDCRFHDALDLRGHQLVLGLR